MARETGIYQRGDSRHWWIATTLPNGQRLRQSAGTEDRTEAEALLAKLKLEAYQGVEVRDQAGAFVAGGRGPVSLRQGASAKFRGRAADLSPPRSLSWAVAATRDQRRRDLADHPG